ncbi:MAG: signal peptidase I [Lachnospiraceae bacterium]|nr:signal peptidase I [Lachnospiraceae bacterium]
MDFGYRERREGVFQQILYEWPILVIEVVIAILLAFLFARFGVEKTTVSGVSMTPVLEEQDTILINRMAYKILSPRRNDVIVYQKQEKEHSYYCVQRVVACPGDTVQIKDGVLYVNGKKEKKKHTPMLTAGIAEEKITLSKGEYFVLGDNRNQSEDSRYSSVGMLTKKNIVGKAWLRLRPKFGLVSWISYNTKEKQEEME